MKVLVTGANGFVGRSLVKRLLESGTTEIIFHTRSPNEPVPDGCKHFAAVVGPETDWTAALQGIEAVFHLAARAHKLADRRSGAEAIAVYRSVNTDGTLRLATQATECGVRRFIFLSSIGVNGSETFDLPFTADDKPDPQTPYALSKLEAERGLMSLAEQSDMEVVIVRAPLVYGAFAPGNLGSLLNAVRQRRPLPLGAIRENRRSLVSVENLVDLLTTGCLRHVAAKNQVFLVCDDHDLSTTELVSTMAHAVGVKARLVPIPLWMLRIATTLVGKPHVYKQLVGNLQVDMAKTRRLLNWAPPKTVLQGFQLVGDNLR
ncbi:NAD-dependent epimerase/dehydratase family protein [Massilia sp. 2TAF26]|uniref:NAD-dependent epimerase/dehydratase family protein n=1 Tax=Massilia sp. 2TAF26 TaxID=3233012 RepID=UPI003F95F645